MSNIGQATALVLRLGDRMIVSGSSRDESGALAGSADDLRDTTQASSEWLANAILETLDSSRNRISDQGSRERSGGTEAQLVRRSGFVSWDEVLREGQQAMVYDYGDEDFDVAALGFVDGREVMLNNEIVSLTRPTPNELAEAVVRALDKYEYRSN